MISHPHKVIFVHIQKTGGESVTQSFGAPKNLPDKHRTAIELRESAGLEIWNSYFKFSIIRNPWERLVSWWSMIEGRRERYEAGAHLNGFQAYVLSNARTFEEFLENCDEEIEDSDGSKWIFRNQFDYVCDSDGHILVDFIARFETIHRDFETISQRASFRPFDLPHANKSNHKHYSSYYTPELVSLVAGRFEKDIQQFGYEFGT